jgi:hypothetical protein
LEQEGASGNEKRIPIAFQSKPQKRMKKNADDPAATRRQLCRNDVTLPATNLAINHQIRPLLMRFQNHENAKKYKNMFSFF